MFPRDRDSDAAAPGADRFSTTHWSVVVAAGQRESPDADSALVTLCNTYWYPLYAFVRRQGYGPEDSGDLTQGFFAKLLEKNYLAVADRERGRFRSFLLSSLKHFLSNDRARARARKRGGDRSFFSLDLESAENRYGREPLDTATPDRLFERRWALTLLDHVLDRLQAEYEVDGKRQVFEHLKQFLTHEKGTLPYRRIGQQMGLSEGAVKVAVHRLRKRYRAILEQEIAHTVSDAAEVEDELRQLFTTLSSENR